MATSLLIDSLTEGDDFVRSYFVEKTEMYVTFISVDYTEMAKNWYEHLKRLNLHNNAIVICLDKKAYDAMQYFGIPSAFADENHLAAFFKHPSIYFTLKHQVSKVLVLYYFNELFPNTDIVFTDVDMIFLKPPIATLRTELSGGYDGCVFIDKYYEDIALQRDKNSGYGGNIIFWQKNAFAKIFSSSAVIDASDPIIGIKVFEEAFNLKLKHLNSFLFTLSEIWNRDHIRNIIKDKTIAIHYSMAADVDSLSRTDFESQIRQKINLMKQYGHWLID